MNDPYQQTHEEFERSRRLTRENIARLKSQPKLPRLTVIDERDIKEKRCGTKTYVCGSLMVSLLNLSKTKEI